MSLRWSEGSGYTRCAEAGFTLQASWDMSVRWSEGSGYTRCAEAGFTLQASWDMSVRWSEGGQRCGYTRCAEAGFTLDSPRAVSLRWSGGGGLVTRGVLRQGSHYRRHAPWPRGRRLPKDAVWSGSHSRRHVPRLHAQVEVELHCHTRCSEDGPTLQELHAVSLHRSGGLVPKVQ